MHEWLSGGAPPCQGGGRGFDPRLVLFIFRSHMEWLLFLYLQLYVKEVYYLSRGL